MKQGLEHLYQQAWEKLEMSTQKTWLALLLTTNAGTTYKTLHRWSGLDKESFSQSIDRLVQLDLVEVLVHDTEKKFRLHSSVRKFLNRKISKVGKGSYESLKLRN